MHWLAVASRPRLSRNSEIWRIKSPAITVQKWQWSKWFVFETSWYAFGRGYLIESVTSQKLKWIKSTFFIIILISCKLFVSMDTFIILTILYLQSVIADQNKVNEAKDWLTHKQTKPSKKSIACHWTYPEQFPRWMPVWLRHRLSLLRNQHLLVANGYQRLNQTQSDSLLLGELMDPQPGAALLFWPAQSKSARKKLSRHRIHLCCKTP